MIGQTFSSLFVLAQWLRDPTELAWKCAQELAGLENQSKDFLPVHPGHQRVNQFLCSKICARFGFAIIDIVHVKIQQK